MLQKKIFRDIWESRWVFLVIVGICSLGIALFSGVNLYVGTVENQVNDYYKRSNLANYWIYKAEVSDSDLNSIKSLSEVKEVQRRKAIDITLPGTSISVLRVHAIDEPAKINAPELLKGSWLADGEANALLLDSHFAEAHGLSVGDTITTDDNKKQTQWLIKGIVRDAEYVYYAPEGLTIPDYNKYGFAYTNASSLPNTAFNEIILTTKQDSNLSQEEISKKVRETIGAANILNRQHQTSYRKVADSMTGLQQIGLLFSIAFFMVAALVTWTTVSRMFENQRQHLGTLRSLGYSKREITIRYALFGIYITVPSAIVGWIIARYVIANSLYAIGITYYTIDATGVVFFTPHFFVSALCVLAATSGAVILTCHKSLKLMPAALMRPKPPARGHRILLERVTPFWRRLSFSGKIVTRNLFRNRVRTLMGLIGVMGSTALILCGFGLMNSINAMLDRTFDETVQYNLEIKLKTPLPTEQLSDIYNTLSGAQNIDATMAFGVYLYAKEGNIQTPYMVVMDENQKSLNFKDMNGNSVQLPQDGVLITPRMAGALGVKVGDKLRAEQLNGTAMPLQVAGIIDFPVGNEIYMSKPAFSKVSNLPFLTKTLLINTQMTDLNKLKNDPRISLVETKEEMRNNLLAVLNALKSFQIILIAFSGLLAFAVMIVRGRMNYHERARELATLKVLGFHKNEMKRLVLRENTWITIFGLPLGYIMGDQLLRVILDQATTPDLEIVPLIAPLSVVIGFALMLAFTLLVNYVIGQKFKRIDMATSLKSVE